MAVTVLREGAWMVGATLRFGEWVKKRRLEIDITQEELAERLGWTDQSRVSRLERNVTRTFPGPEELKLMAEALETTPEVALLAMGYVELPLSELDDDAAYFTMMQEATEQSQLPETLKAAIRDTLGYVMRQQRRMQGE